MCGFGLINMNGRLYDPYLQRFLSPDPYVQFTGNTQNFNRYSYVLNNPFMYTDPDGEWIWLVFAAYGAWTMGVKAGVAAETAGGHFWKDGFWKGALVGFAAGALGGSGLAPFGTQWLGTTAWGAMVGVGSQAGTIWAMGGSVYSKIWHGALLGGTMGFMASEQFGNWVNNKGFVSNNQVLKNFEAGKYGVTAGGTWQQDALDYFFGEGSATYQPQKPSGGKYVDSDFYIGAVNPNTGKISLGDDAFFSYKNGEAVLNFDRLKGTYYGKELYTKNKILSGKVPATWNEHGNIPELRRQMYFPEEALSFRHAYRNQGLYLNSGINWLNQANTYWDLVYAERLINHNFFHFIYKIPRIW